MLKKFLEHLKKDKKTYIYIVAVVFISFVLGSPKNSDTSMVTEKTESGVNKISYSNKIGEISNEEATLRFRDAVYAGKIDLMRTMLGKGANPNHRDPPGKSENNGRPILHKVVEAGALDKLINPKFNQPPEKEYVEVVELMLKKGADPNAIWEIVDTVFGTGVKRATPMGNAAGYGNIEIIKLLLQHGAEVNGGSTSPLLSAVISGRANTVLFLLENGANPNPSLKNGKSALMTAKERGHNSIVSMITKALGARVNKISPLKASQNLFSAVKEGNIKLVKQSLKNGANPDFSPSDDVKPLFTAVTGDNAAMVKILLDNGADLNGPMKQNSPNSIFSIATGKNNPEIIKMFLDKGVNVNMREVYGTTPLILAAMDGRAEAVKLLLQYGADTTVRDQIDGSTALDHARKNGHREIVNLLN